MTTGVNYTSTFITVAPDCPVEVGTVPPERGGTPTVASTQHALVTGSPYTLTSEDVIFQSSTDRRGLGVDADDATVEAAQAAYFERPRACLRASPLPKSYGWGVHCDEQGRVALYAVESHEYRRLCEDPAVTVVPAMRSKRG